MLNIFNSFNGDISLKRINKRPFSGVAFLKWNWMLVPSISKAKTSFYGTRSVGTSDYRNGAKVRPKVVFKTIGCSGDGVLKKRSINMPRSQ